MFSLSSATSGYMPFDVMDIAATFDKARLTVSKGRLTGPAGSLDLRGVIDMPTSGLALAGRYDPNAVPTSASGTSPVLPEGQPVTSGARFFIGGTWPQAVITPLSVLAPDR